MIRQDSLVFAVHRLGLDICLSFGYVDSSFERKAGRGKRIPVHTSRKHGACLKSVGRMTGRLGSFEWSEEFRICMNGKVDVVCIGKAE